MSKFEPEAKKQTCWNCRHADKSCVLTSYPAQIRCTLFGKLVFENQTECLEDKEPQPIKPDNKEQAVGTFDTECGARAEDRKLSKEALLQSPRGSGEWVERKENIDPDACETEDQEPKVEEPSKKRQIVQLEWWRDKIVNIRFVENEEGYEDTKEALDHFVEGWIEERKEEQKKEEPKLYEVSPADEIIEASKKFAKEPSLAKYVYSVEIMKAEYGHRLDNMEAHIAKIEERLNNIDEYLTEIGSPNYDLRKKYEDLKRRLSLHLYHYHYNDLTEEQKELIKFLDEPEAKPDKKDIEGINEALKIGEYDLRKKVEKLEKGFAQFTDTFHICAKADKQVSEELWKRIEKLEKEVFGADGVKGLVAVVVGHLRSHKESEISSVKALETRVEDLEKRLRNY